MTDENQVCDVHRLKENIEGPDKEFAVMLPSEMSMDCLEQIRKSPFPYFVAPVPKGERFLLITNAKSEIFLENNKRNIFQLEGAFLSSSCSETVLDCILVNDNSQNANSRQKARKPTFFITDAMKYDGHDLTRKSVVDRLDCIMVSRKSTICETNMPN